MGLKPDNRRVQPRHAFALEVAVRGPKGIVCGRCQELTPEGLFLEIPEIYPERTDVDVKFLLPGDASPIVCAGRVASVQRSKHARNFYWMWIQFLDLRVEYVARLRQFLGTPASAPEPTPPAPSRPEHRRPGPRAKAAEQQRRVAHAAKAAKVRARTEPALPVRRGGDRGLGGGRPVRLGSPPKRAAPAAPAGKGAADPTTTSAAQARTAPASARTAPSVERMDAFVIRFGSVREFATTYAENISKGGVFLRTNNPDPEQTPVMLILQLPDGGPRVYVEGMVVWVRAQPTPGMGIQFGKLSDAACEAIEAFLLKVQQTKPLTLNMWKMSKT